MRKELEEKLVKRFPPWFNDEWFIWRLCVDPELWLWSLRRRLGSASSGRMSGQSLGWPPCRLAMLGRAQSQVNATAGPGYPSRISAPGAPLLSSFRHKLRSGTQLLGNDCVNVLVICEVIHDAGAQTESSC